jgi:hypothetical protein
VTAGSTSFDVDGMFNATRAWNITRKISIAVFEYKVDIGFAEF